MQWGKEKALRGELNLVTTIISVETYGEDGVTLATVKVYDSEAFGVASSAVTPDATLTAR